MVLDFQNNKWRLNANKSFPTIPNNKILNLGLQFTSQYLIVQVSTNNQSDTWQVAGKIWATSHIFAAPTKFFEQNLELTERQLITIPKTYQNQYSLNYRAPRHFTNVKIKIWEYIEEIATKSDYLREKVDLLLEQNKALEALVKSLVEKEEQPPSPEPTIQEEVAILRTIGRL